MWLDLLEPTVEEERRSSRRSASTCPRARRCARSRPPTACTRTDGALYMTSTVVWKADTGAARDHPGHLHPHRLAAGHQPLRRPAVVQALRRLRPELIRRCAARASLLLTGLLEAIINRIADVLERVGADIDTTSLRVFPRGPGRPRARHDLPGRSCNPRPERRADLQGTRDAAQPDAPGRVPAAEHRRQGHAGGARQHAHRDARRRRPERPRHLPGRQDAVPARCDARSGDASTRTTSSRSSRWSRCCCCHRR